MLYRKYRPKNFSQVFGQKHIVKTLSGAILNNRLGHAYLFTGPRGTGKTSVARILAKAINCENPQKALSCDKCSNCQTIEKNQSLDIIEIDAASNTGVDNIRELKETVILPPSKLKYKVYIIDEVHMLSSGAFNALLKTLEEPPSHVIFILATTEIHKVPETILSRCQRFDFVRLSIQNIIEKLSSIAKQEKVKIEKEALEMIALSSEGGMRDAETLLSQIIALEDKEITAHEVDEILGTTQKETITKVVQNILEKNSEKAIAKINDLLKNGYDLDVFFVSLINCFRQLMLLKVSPELKKYFSFEAENQKLEKLSQKAELSEISRNIEIFLKAKNSFSISSFPQLPLEIAVIKATGKIPKNIEKEDKENLKKNSQNEILEKNKQKSTKDAEITQKVDFSPSVTEPNSSVDEEKNISEESISLSDINSNWNKLLIDIKPFNHSLGVLLTNCKPIKTDGSKLTLATPYEFYKEKLSIPEHKLTVEKVFAKILKSKISLEIIIDKNIFPKKEEKNQTKNPSTEKTENGNLLDSALEIFGGKVVE